MWANVCLQYITSFDMTVSGRRRENYTEKNNGKLLFGCLCKNPLTSCSNILVRLQEKQRQSDKVARNLGFILSQSLKMSSLSLHQMTYQHWFSWCHWREMYGWNCSLKAIRGLYSVNLAFLNCFYLIKRLITDFFFSWGSNVFPNDQTLMWVYQRHLCDLKANIWVIVWQNCV